MVTSSTHSPGRKVMVCVLRPASVLILNLQESSSLSSWCSGQLESKQIRLGCVAASCHILPPHCQDWISQGSKLSEKIAHSQLRQIFIEIVAFFVEIRSVDK